MGLLLLSAFVGLPIIEIVVIIKVGGLIGAWPTVGFIILSAVLGSAMVRAQGFHVLMRAQENLDRGVFPAEELFHGVALLVAGLMLITPGFVTDAFGLALLIPPVRRVLGRLVWRWMMAPDSVRFRTRWGRRTHRDDGVIETEYHEIPQERLGPGRDDDPRR